MEKIQILLSHKPVLSLLSLKEDVPQTVARANLSGPVDVPM